MNAQQALYILGDPSGFFPIEWRDQARKIVESQGTEEQKKLAEKSPTFAQSQGRGKMSGAVEK